MTPSDAQAAAISSPATLARLEGLVDERTRDILLRREKSTVRRRGWLVRRALCVADVVGIALAFVVAQWLLGSAAAHGYQGGFDPVLETVLLLATLPAWVVVAKLYGLYDRDEERTDHSTIDEFSGVFHMVTVGTWLFFAGSWLTGLADPRLDKLVAFWALAVAAVVLGRTAARAYCRRQVAYLQNTVIVGAGEVGQTVAAKILKHREYGLNVVGFVDGEPKERGEGLGQLALLGSPDDLPAIVRAFDVERVIVAFSNEPHERMLSLLRGLKEHDVQIDIVPRLFELVAPGMEVHTVEGLPLLGLAPPRLSSSSKLLKRTMDVTLSAVALVVLLPLFALVALAIRRDSPGPVFFRQVRMGQGGRTFRIVKFRTMAVDAEARKAELKALNRWGEGGKMFKVERDPRVTRLGRLLRRTCVDELPQLWNVLRGEMSLVGPRPLILDESAHVRDWARRRLDLRPGMTGLWQVLGSSSIAFDEMVRLDYLYVSSWSLANDLRLLGRTLPIVVRGAEAR